MRSITLSTAVAVFPFVCAAAPIASAASVHVTDPVGVTLGLDEDDLESVTLAIDRTVLDTPAGVAAVHRAIRNAARHVCASYLGDDGAVGMRDCRAEAAATAEAQLDVEIANLKAGSTLYAAR